MLSADVLKEDGSIYDNVSIRKPVARAVIAFETWSDDYDDDVAAAKMIGKIKERFHSKPDVTTIWV